MSKEIESTQITNVQAYVYVCMCAGMGRHMHCLGIYSFVVERKTFIGKFWNNIIAFLTMTIFSFNIEDYTKEGERASCAFYFK